MTVRGLYGRFLAPRARFLSLVIAVLLAGTSGSAQAQQDQYEPPPLPVDPTPLIDLVTAKEREELNRNAGNLQKLVETYLLIASRHVEAALTSIKDNDYKISERELDIYNKAIAQATKTASTQVNNRRKLGKKLEQEIYKHLKTLESIERYFPADRTPFIEFALKHAKQVRSQALNMTFDSGEILKDPAKDNKKSGQARRRLPPSLPHATSEASVKTIVSLSPIARFGRGEFAWQTHIRPASVGGAKPDGLAQEVDYLTEEEDDFVRQAQDPELRAKVFMKIADRRLEAITGKPTEPKDKKAQQKAEEEERRWGVLPKLDRVEYLRHYTRAIDELMIKLEDAFERNPKAKSMEKALGVLRESTEKQLTILRSLTDQMTSDVEKRVLMQAIEKAETANQGAKARPKSG